MKQDIATQADTAPATTNLDALADEVDQIIAHEHPEQAKELLRLLIKEVRVHNRRRIIPTYRIPAAVRAIPSKVGGTGLEPVTPSLSSRSDCFPIVRSVPRLCTTTAGLGASEADPTG